MLENGLCLIGTEDGDIIAINDEGAETIGSISESDEIIELHVFNNNTWAATSSSRGLYVGEYTVEFEFPVPIKRSIGYIENNEPYIAGIGDGTLVIFHPSVVIAAGNVGGGELLQYDRQSLFYDSYSIEGTVFGYPIALDIDHDGLVDFVNPIDTYLYAFNQRGSVLDYFPVNLGENTLGGVYPVAADFDGNGTIDIAVSNNNNIVRFHNFKGIPINGTPLAVGEQIVGSPAIFEFDGNVAVAFVTADNLLYAYKFSGTWNEELVWWGEERLNSRRTNVQTITTPRQPISDEFLPEDRAYNWPNPVYDGTTNIRYYLSENADVSISIYEMNGDLITSFDGPGIGGIDNEVTWDASGVQSGVYLGRIEARSSNNSNILFIKIAVVR